MQTQKSEIERSLETILRNEQPAANCSLAELLPEPSFTGRSQQIKRNISDFIQKCLNNKKLVEEMVDRGVKSSSFANEYQKNLALFSVEMLGGDYGDSYKMFIEEEEESKSIRKSKTLKNESEIEEEIEVEPISPEEHFKRKYSNFMYLLEYIRRPLAEISEVNMSYFTKIMTNIISNKTEDAYAYFEADAKGKASRGQQMVTEGKKEEEVKLEGEKSDLDILLSHCYNFGGMSEVLGKMVSEQGPANKFVPLKKKIIQGILDMLKMDSNLRSNTNNYSSLLDFVSYVLARTKYKSDDSSEQIGKVCQRFVDESTIWFFKEKAVKAVIESNNLLTSNCMNSSGCLNRSQSSKSAKKEAELRPQNQEQLRKLENAFENAVAYLQIIAERINSQEEVDKYETENEKPAQPTMDFQVNEALFQQNALYELFTLSVPACYSSINKMSYYELLLKLTRNSRFKKASPENQMGLLPSFLTPILIHLLKMFRRESRKNGLVNFYIGELICQAILPRIATFDTKQAMMVLSALNPTEEVLNKFNDTKAFTQKILIIMKRKCEWLNEHFIKFGLDLKAIKENFKVKLGGNSSVLHNRKNTIKEFDFLFEEDKNSSSKKIIAVDKSDRLQDEGDSSDSQKDLKQFKSRREFEYPEGQSRKKKEPQTCNDDLELEQNLFCNSDNEIKQQIHVSNSDIVEETGNKDGSSPSKERKNSQIQLLVDSAGEEDEVITEESKKKEQEDREKGEQDKERRG